jgi:hypothetical protein
VDLATIKENKMGTKAFIKRIPALKGESAGPPRGLFDANQIAKVWVKEGYPKAQRAYVKLIADLNLSRIETVMLSDLVVKQKLNIERTV